MKIYGDRQSGNCLKVKWVCDHLALPYDWIEVDTLKSETRTPEFLKLNSAGQVPTVQFDDGRTLAQSNAIIRYLARASDLIPIDDFAAAKIYRSLPRVTLTRSMLPSCPRLGIASVDCPGLLCSEAGRPGKDR